MKFDKKLYKDLENEEILDLLIEKVISSSEEKVEVKGTSPLIPVKGKILSFLTERETQLNILENDEGDEFLKILLSIHASGENVKFIPRLEAWDKTLVQSKSSPVSSSPSDIVINEKNIESLHEHLRQKTNSLAQQEFDEIFASALQKCYDDKANEKLSDKTIELEALKLAIKQQNQYMKFFKSAEPKKADPGKPEADEKPMLGLA